MSIQIIHSIPMPVISARITEELETEIEEHIKEDGLEKSVAVRKLISSAIKEWRKEKASKMQGGLFICFFSS